MLLSIVMMMKNEERYLNKTLKALQPLMNDIKSELIVLDTGSTDSSIDIAKKYTGKVYFEKWNNNFSDMRNKSISYAKGEWILILDADEELMDYKKLKDFFETEKYKKYNTGTIELKNIFSEDEKKYSLGSIPRLFRNTKGFRYEGAIHEQPKYLNPVYNNIARFKHYGYMFKNEELRQAKTERNMGILLNELEKNPNNAYINYQIAQSYNVISKSEDALFYLEKSYELYKKIGRIPVYVTSDLARLYLSTKKLSKCEKICVNYIKNDNNNIDIYFYLASAKKQLGKFKESLKCYERYMYLLENYHISTQANNMECTGDTISFRDTCKLSVIDIYYNMENYNEIVKKISEVDIDTFNKVQYIIFDSLYRTNKLDEVVELYNEKTSTLSEKIKFKDNLEYLLLTVRESDKDTIYSIYSKLGGNYEVLNNVRIDNKININQFNTILKNETSIYYGDLIYYAINQKIKLEDLLNGVSYISTKNFIDYLVINRKDIVTSLYEYLVNTPNTLDTNKLSLYSILSKSLLTYGNLTGSKYELLFLMYIKYSYVCIKSVYKESLSNEEIISIIRDKEDSFVININSIEKNKHKDKAKYIRELKRILLNNKHHKKGIELLIQEVQKSLHETEDLKVLKLQYKTILENTINNGNIKEANNMIIEYENMFGEEAELLNIKSVLCILNKEFNRAEVLLKKSIILDSENFNTIFNIGYLKELSGDIEDAMKFYKLIVTKCKEQEIVLDAKEKLKKYEI